MTFRKFVMVGMLAMGALQTASAKECMLVKEEELDGRGRRVEVCRCCMRDCGKVENWQLSDKSACDGQSQSRILTPINLNEELERRTGLPDVGQQEPEGDGSGGGVDGGEF